MRKYKDVTETVVRRGECVEVRCDMCRRVAEYPSVDVAFEWGGAGAGYGRLESYRAMDGEDFRDVRDLCPDCADWLIEQITLGWIRRPHD